MHRSLGEANPCSGPTRPPSLSILWRPVPATVRTDLLVKSI